MNLLEGLNDKQQDAVEALDGVIKVIAGAGSGKTKALTHRYAYLVDMVGMAPANILCITFTNKAANEMRHRIRQMVSLGGETDYVCTIHGFCRKVLQEEIYRIGYPKTFSILDDEDKKTLAKQVMDELGIDKTQTNIKNFLADIASFKAKEDYVGKYMVPDSFKEEIYKNSDVFHVEATPKDDLETKRASFLKLFLQKQLKTFALDFDDLINYTLYIWGRFSECKKTWQQRFDYIMVDETQDLNKVDWMLIDILREKCGNLFAVGDPDQAIYEWRGAYPDAFINLPCDKQIIMDQNYRSTANILDVANSVIKYNTNRIEKDLFTLKERADDVIYYHGKNDEDESKWIVNQMKSIKSSGVTYSSIAVLVRASFQTRIIEKALVQQHIPYVVWGGVRFYERKEIKDALCYLRLLNEGDDLSFLRIVNVPSRKLGKAYLAKLKKYADEDGTTLYKAMRDHIEEKGLHKESAVAFIKTMEELEQEVDKISISDLLQDTLRKTGLGEYYRVDPDEDRTENLKELAVSIDEYEEAHKEDEVTLSSYLQDIALLTNMDSKKDSETVKLMTIHQSKGLEFPYVFVTGLTEGIFPSYKSIRERGKKALEEERRLMYVAITRAEKALFLTESEGYMKSENTEKYPSRFLQEIQKEFLLYKGNFHDGLWLGTDRMKHDLECDLPEFKEDKAIKEGDYVKHKLFGVGIVQESDETKQKCSVEFPDKGIRHLLWSFLEKLTPSQIEEYKKKHK